MYRTLMFLVGLVLTGVTSSALAQPHSVPEGDGRRGEPHVRPPLLNALDTNGDHEISAEEIAKAGEALNQLDKNKDGKLTRDEIRPEFKRRGLGRAEGPRGRGSNAGRGRGIDRHRRPGPGGNDRRRGYGRPGGRGGAERHGDRDRPERSGKRRRPDRPGFGGPGGRPPGPEAFVERAMRFDENGDGQLSKEELMKMAEDRHHGSSGGRRRDETPTF